MNLNNSKDYLFIILYNINFNGNYKHNNNRKI